MVSRFALVGILVVAAMTAPRLSAQSFVSFTGTITDPLGALLPAVRLVLTNTQSEAKYEVRSSRLGQFEFVGLPPGSYVLDVALPGFRTLRHELAVGGQNVSRILTLELGELEETLRIVAGAGPSPSAARSTDPAAADGARRAFRTILERCNAAALAGGPAMGGNIRPPRKIRSVAPQYPAAAAEAGVDGTVRLLATIGADGYVRDIQSVDPDAHADLVNAGIEAVRGWEFDGTLLNCVPVEVTMHVTLQFEVR